jgi:hypothetical protein
VAVRHPLLLTHAVLDRLLPTHAVRGCLLRVTVVASRLWLITAESTVTITKPSPLVVKMATMTLLKSTEFSKTSFCGEA